MYIYTNKENAIYAKQVFYDDIYVNSNFTTVFMQFCIFRRIYIEKSLLINILALKCCKEKRFFFSESRPLYVPSFENISSRI